MASALSQTLPQRKPSLQREYMNPYRDYDPKSVNSFIELEPLRIRESFKTLILQKAKEMMGEIGEAEKARNVSESGYCIYTGVSGVALVALFAGRRIDAKYTKYAKELLKDAYKGIQGHRITFLSGPIGTLALAAGECEENDRTHYNILCGRMHNMLPDVCDPLTDISDELLYGRCGFLYGMLYANKHLHEHVFLAEDIRRVINCILVRGQALAHKKHSLAPLVFEWHEKEYYGAAHGTAGILHVLLQARSYIDNNVMMQVIRPTLDNLLTKRFPTGNFPSSIGNSTERLMQWCHGAPGFVSLLVLAYEVFEDETYLEAADLCCDIIWERGILKKGCGLCHGTSGNAYAFISMYKIYKVKGLESSAAKQLYRACAFTDWCFEYKKHRERVPDRPLSLYEGKSGIVYLLLDMLEPENAKFPGYDL